MKKKLLVMFMVSLLSLSVFTVGVNAASVTGPGGTARIEYLKSSKLISWGVKPATANPYQFRGYITFGGGASGKVSAGIAFGLGSDGDVEPARGKGYCSATLSGTAYVTLGGTFKVLPGVSCYYNI